MSEVRERIAEMADNAGCETILLPEEYDSAILGVINGEEGEVIAVYSEMKIIEKFMESTGCLLDEAREYYEFNIAGAYLGKTTPIYIDDYSINI